MGNTTQKTENNNQQLQLCIKHPKLSGAKYVQPKNPNQLPYLQLTQQVANRQVFQKWKLRINNYMVGPNQIQSIYIPSDVRFEEKGICGSSGVIKSRYIVLPYVLSQEIENRSNNQQNFLEKELWYLLYILAIAGATAHSRGLVLGDVRPQNVLISQDGQICTCCTESFLDEQKNFIKTMRLKILTYLSPQQVKNLQQGKFELNQGQQISQSFSIGLTVLSAILLKDMKCIYGTNYSFNEQLLAKQLGNLKNSSQYSRYLIRIVEGLLALKPNQRLTAQQTVSILMPYQQQIINLEEFQFQQMSIPPELKAKILNPAQINLKGLKTNEYKKVINNSDFNSSSRVKYIQTPKNSAVVYQQAKSFSNPAVSARQVNQVPQPQLQQPPLVNANYINFPVNKQGFNQNINLNKENERNQQPKVTVTQSLFVPNQNYIVPPPPHQFPISNQNSFNPQFHLAKNQGKSELRGNDNIFPVPAISNPYIVQNHPEMKPIQNINSNFMVVQPPVFNRTQPNFQAPPSNISFGNSSIPAQNKNAHLYGGNNSSIKSPEVNSNISKIDSYTPGQNLQMNKRQVYETKIINQSTNKITNVKSNNNLFPQPVFSTNLQPAVKGANSSKNVALDFAPRRLEQFGRQATSIRPPPDKSKEKIFESYEEVMKDIDQKLRQSKAMFPDHV